MDLEKYKLLKNKRIVEVLDGDETFGDFKIHNTGSYFGVADLKIAMPRLSGPDICDVAKTFGSTTEYTGMKSRWQYMFDLIDYGISSGRIPSILAYLFDESNFTRDIGTELSKDEFKKYHDLSVESALERINTILHFGGNKMIIDNRIVLMVSNNTSDPEISIKNIRSVDRDYIKLLSKRAIGNVDIGNYDLLRKLSLLYIQEVRNNRQGVIRKHFSSLITNDDEQNILDSLYKRYEDNLEENINFSSDQSEKLKQEISDAGIQEYPDIYKDKKLNVSDTKDFLLRLSNIFNWPLYERQFIAANQSPEIQDEVIDDYTKMTLLWISGFSLRHICDIAISIRRKGDYRFLDRLDRHRSDIHNINWDTITINVVMRQLQTIQFVLGKYFLKVTTELTKNGIPPVNDWYRYMEYGTCSDLRIWLQQNGYSREASAYIEDNQDNFIIQAGDNYFISQNIIQANDLDTVNETKEIKVNVPEIFI